MKVAAVSVICTCVAFSSTSPTALQRQAQIVSAKAKQVKDEAARVRQADAQFEAAVQQKRSEYAQREYKASLNALDGAVKCLLEPDGCLSKAPGSDGKPSPWPEPSMIDIFKILRDALNDRIFPTVQDL